MSRSEDIMGRGDIEETTNKNTTDMREKLESLKRMIAWGLSNKKHNIIADLDLLAALTSGLLPVGNNQLAPEDMSQMIYDLKAERDVLKEQRDRFLGFCRTVLPESHEHAACWDREIGAMYVELQKKNRLRLLNFLDSASSYCPIEVQNKVREFIAAEDKRVHPSRLLEALKEIAEYNGSDLVFRDIKRIKDIAIAALQEIGPKNDYSN